MIHVDLTKIDWSDLDGPTLLDKGRYKFEILSVIHSDSIPSESAGKPHVRIGCRVVDGPGNVGAYHSERFYLSENAIKRFANFLKRMGLLDRGDFGSSLEIDENELVGKIVVADVIQEDFTGRDGKTYTSSKWGYMSFWLEGDEPGGASGRNANGKRAAVAAPPKDPDMFSDL